jgi:hypothetical protein
MLSVRIPTGAGATGGGPVTVKLMQGASTTIGTWTIATPIPNGLFEFNLTAAEANNITDYDDLRVRLTTAS